MHHLHALTKLLASPSPAHLLELVGFVAVVAATVYLAVHLQPALLLSLGVGLEIFSGYWRYMGIPLPLDRLLIVLAFCVLAWRGMRSVSDRHIPLSAIHVLFVVIVVWVVCSAIAAHTLTTSTGFYSLLDRLGVFPYLTFVLAPILFGDRRSRSTLLAVLVAVGFYLGAVSIAEGLHVDKLVIPSYINNPNLGIHFGRARGPFLEAVANGLCIFMCDVAAAIGFVTWRNKWSRVACAVAILPGPVALIMTFTRTNWLAAAAGIIMAMAVDRRLRRWIPGVLVVGAVVVLGTLVADAHLRHRVFTRSVEVSPLWDRYNITWAGIRATEAHPLFGVGWMTFPVKGIAYLRQAAAYPMTGIGLEVHNAFLERLAENGVPLTLLWVWALVSGIGGAMVRRCPRELYAWRLGLVAIVTAWFIAANLDPMAYPLPNLLIWLWAGIVSADWYSVRAEAFTASRAEEDVRLLEGTLVG